MSENLPGRTERESREYLKDRGHRVAAAQAYAYIGRLIGTDDSYPLPDGCDDIILAAATAMRDIAARRLASAEAYAHERLAVNRAAVAVTVAAMQPASAA